MSFKLLERATIAVSLIGALLVATDSGLSWLGYVFFLFSSLAFCYIGLRAKLESVLVVNAAFTVINLFGLFNFWSR